MHGLPPSSELQQSLHDFICSVCCSVPSRPGSSRRATKTDKLPSGGQWLHEIKHDGFRVIARKDGLRVRLYSRPGNDLTRRFPLIVDALARPRSRSCIIDGEAVACDDNGVASFDLIRHHRANDSIARLCLLAGEYRDVAGAVAVEILDAPPITRMVNVFGNVR